MLLLLSLAALAYGLWSGGRSVGLLLMALGVIVQLWQSARLLRATVGGVGGHAEWVRDVVVRPRLGRSPAWLVALLLTLVGFALATF